MLRLQYDRSECFLFSATHLQNVIEWIPVRQCTLLASIALAVICFSNIKDCALMCITWLKSHKAVHRTLSSSIRLSLLNGSNVEEQAVAT